jgi:hypothetical protein
MANNRRKMNYDGKGRNSILGTGIAGSHVEADQKGRLRADGHETFG